MDWTAGDGNLTVADESTGTHNPADIEILTYTHEEVDYVKVLYEGGGDTGAWLGHVEEDPKVAPGDVK